MVIVVDLVLKFEDKLMWKTCGTSCALVV